MTATQRLRKRRPPEAESAPPPRLVHGWVDEVDLAQRQLRIRTDRGLVTVTCDGADTRRQLAGLSVDDVVTVRCREGNQALYAESIALLNRCESIPVSPRTMSSASAALRARYRYLELRDPEVLRVFRLRHRIMHSIACELDRRGFISVETPLLSPVSASGAREFRVSSQRDPALAYALPQSPQIYGQLLVAGGVQAYYQFARCFRDEDLRANRQPEFTQLHLEMAFVDREQILTTVEGVLASAYDATSTEANDSDGGAAPFARALPRLTFDQAKLLFGSDKPDLRCDFSPQMLPHLVSEAGKPERNLVLLHPPRWLKLEAGDWASLRAIAEQLRFELVGFVLPMRARAAERFAPVRLSFEEAARHFGAVAEPRSGLLPLFCGRWTRIDRLRSAAIALARRHTPPDGELRFCWVTDFPLFAEEPDGALVAQNHPFTAPVAPDELLANRPRSELLRLKAHSFDLVLNGEELASGSLLITDWKLQQHVLNLLGYTRGQIQEHFGYLIEALRYGAPPIGGIGIGMDRLVAAFANRTKIRDVIAFPKTKQGYCPVTRQI